MTKFYLYLSLVLIVVLSSCSLHEVEDSLNPQTDDINYQLSSELSINTLDASKADFSIDHINNILNERDQLIVTNNSSNAVSYHWDFGNGDKSEEAIPEYNYKRHGEYTVTLTISDKVGNTKTMSQDLTVLCVFIGNIHTDF